MIKDKERIILKKADSLSKQLAEDIEFARRTEEAWKEYEQGKFRTVDFNDYLKELRK
ncbi:hypothetical protein HY486_03720 [Candidatus Woesearchaeota archaeon]|nr:hypothetical protein [Candidatus Woesearchaeota archaeon]